MKNLIRPLILIVILSCSFTSFSQNYNQNTAIENEGWVNFNPNQTNYPEAQQQLPNLITKDLFLTNDKTYLISGDVFVAKNVTLTIQEGTIIRCDYKDPAHLFIPRGAKLIAAGSKEYPIIFTSNKPFRERARGDWGGITIAGSGKVNNQNRHGIAEGNFPSKYARYGGSNNHESTTILKYVRIEFAGNTTKRSKGNNGLSLLAVGNGSVIDNIMVSHSGQDSFHIKGGKYQFKNLLSFRSKDDDFEIGEGFKGELSNILAVRHPYIKKPAGSYAIEISGHNKNQAFVNRNAVTDVVVNKATLVNLTNNTNFKHAKEAISATNGATMYLHESKVSGFSDVVKFDESYTSFALIENTFFIDNSFFNIHGNGVKVSYSDQKEPNIFKYNRFTKKFKSVDKLFSSPLDMVAPKFKLKQALNAYNMVMQ